MGKNYNSSRLVNGLSVDASGNVTLSNNRVYYGKDGSNMTWFGTKDAISEPNNLAFGFESNGTSIQSFRVMTAGSNRLYINASGNVGISTSSPNIAGFSGKCLTLEAGGTTSAVSAGIELAWNGVTRSLYGGYSGGVYIGTWTNENFELRTNGSERMRILSNGNVLINATSDPSVKLQVVQTNSGEWTGDFKNYTIGAYGLRVDLSGSTGSPSNSAFQIYTQTGSGLRVVNNGSVTIGSVSNYSQYKLVITSTGTTNATAAFRCEDSATYGLFEVLSDGAIKMGGRTNSPYNYAVTGSIKAAYLDSNGGFGYNSSTRESKANIKSMNSVNWLNQLTPVTFNKRKKDEDGNYTDDFYDELHYGFIADEMEAINQDFVFYDEMDGNKKLAGIHYDRLIAPLVKAIQELSAEVEELKAQINK